MSIASVIPSQIHVRLPRPHKAQNIFYFWNEDNPKARFLIAPCGTKLGKSFGSAMWLTKEAMVNPGIFCIWVAPTYRKAKIGYRYIKAMMPDCEYVNTKDGKLEIILANGSTIHFLHGRDAEVTIEGEAVDRAVIDEAGKIIEQVWFSLFTTLSQTRGLAIITGTPRGNTWYKDLYRKARKGRDKTLIGVNLPTELSPYVTKDTIKLAERTLPSHLYKQYYKAEFVSNSTVFGDLGGIWDGKTFSRKNGCIKSLAGDMPRGKVKFWFHPDKEAYKGYITHGVDLAKTKDYTVFYSVNQAGQLVAYARFNKVSYKNVAARLRKYIERYFPEEENMIRYDATGVGNAVGENISEEFEDSPIDVTVVPVVFTNKDKADWVTNTILAIEEGWHKAPRIEELENELESYEVQVTKSGNYTYAAAEGEHDDTVSAMLLAVPHAHEASKVEGANEVLVDAMKKMNGISIEQDVINAYADVATDNDEDNFDIEDDDSFFEEDANEEEFEFDEETA